MGHEHKSTSHIMQEETQAYHASNSNPVKQLITKWETEIWKIVKDFDLDMDEWQEVIPDPDQTHRRVTQYQ